MLTPSYLLHATEPAEEIAERLHQEIINRIIERILRRFKRGDDYILTAQDKWQIEVLQDAGFLLEDIQKEIVAAVPYMQSELVAAMEDAGVRALDYDDAIYRAAGLNPTDLTQSPSLIRLMQRDFEATLGEWTNFTRTTANAAQQTFIRVCDTAYHQAMTGAVSVSQAVKEAIADLITEGISIQYANGYKTTIEAATARAVRTGISQASAHIQLARMDEMEVDLVLVSSHLGARPSHQVWQGKVYSRNGGDDYPDFVESTGYGTVTGLCGANCRHNFGPYFEGMDNPFEQYDAKANKKAYETQQKQRAMERRIRDTKRQTMNWKEAMDKETDPVKKAMFEAEYQRKAALLQKQNVAYRQFCKDNDLKLQPDRISIAKWDRQQAAMARWAAAKNTQKSVANSTESVIIKNKVGIQFFAKVPESKFVEYALNPDKAPDKARVFKSALGYDLDNYEDLMENIKSHINEEKFVEKGDNGHGMRYEYIMKLTGPNGKEANVLTAWIQDGDDKRMTSVYVTKREATE